jgi:cytochrome c-type biogenesis protein CcmF
MIIELGLFALVLALVVALAQSALPMWGARVNDRGLMRLGQVAAVLQFALVAFSFAALTSAYWTSDFSVQNVFENSHSLMPDIYRITGVWGNHEGSMLLWVLILSIFGALVALLSGQMPERLRANTLGVQGVVAVAFIGFVLFTSNPFARLADVPPEGRDLNPVLQDLGLAIHPPLLYLGYVGFSICFSFAIAALIDGRIDAAFARYMRPWALLAWIFLTLGIAMGSYWAYYELGWGGWWFWDPVENASLMPWLTGTALLHSAIVMEKRGALKVWTILLAILTFSLSLLGTFLVRSGVLTSVHSFASDPTRGVFILAILCFFIGGGFALFAWRAPRLGAGGAFAPVSREGALVFNNLFLSVTCVAVLVGTLYPLALEALTGAKISVGPPFFVATVLPLTLPLIIAMPFGQQLAWKRGELLGIGQRLLAAMVLGIAGGLMAMAAHAPGPVMAPIGFGIGVFLMVGSLSELWTRAARAKGSIPAIAVRMFRLPRAAWGAAIAHAGMGVMVIGISATAFEVERIVTLESGQTVRVGPHVLMLDGVVPETGPNYRQTIARLTVRNEAGVEIGTLQPAKRIYAARQMPTSETARLTQGFSQLYVAVGDMEANGVAIRAYWKPFVLLIWLGCVVMGLGGILSLLDGRLRIGAPVRARLKGAAREGASA